MGKIKKADLQITCTLLLEQQRYSEVIEVIGLALPAYEDSQGWAEVLRLLRCVPEKDRLESIQAATLYARTLRICGDLETLLEWYSLVSSHHTIDNSAAVQVEAAGALNGLKRYAEARDTLNKAIPHLSGESLGIAWSRLGYALFHLGEPWREAYVYARSLLAGEELGRALLNEGYCLARSEQRLEAQNVMLEALACFRDNPYFLAWIRYNLGINGLRELNWVESERHFLEAMNQTHRASAAPLKAAVFNGLGASRRVLGECNRAETVYRLALKSAGDSYDRTESYVDLARTLRLSGRPTQALESLNLALKEPALDKPMLYVAQALAYLALSQTERANTALERVGPIRSEADQWIHRIAQAELARQEGRLDEAVALLDGLPLHTLHAREEVRQFPLLFDLLRAAGKEVPQPLEYVQGTTVWVKAQGVLEVSVNGRPIEMHPTGRVGELLVFLLEQGGAATLEVIEDALYSSRPYSRRRQAIWNLVKKLREALGWEDSVRSLHRAYQLDPAATWHYDIAQARARGEFAGKFLEGIYTEWAQEVGQELQNLNLPRPDHRLN